MAKPRRVDNPPNPHARWQLDWDEGPPPDAKLVVFEERSKSILSENANPRLDFRFSLNPYRGCAHGCVYCYARPTHRYWGFGAGTDFDTKIVVKTNAPELLARRLGGRAWSGDVIVFSGNTDCYQPLEVSYALTRACLEVCRAHRNPVGVITKSSVVRRDIALLAELHEVASARVTISVAFDDDEVRRALDPFAAPVDARFETMRRLSDAGIPIGVGLAPVILGLNDSMIPSILARAADAGASYAFMTPLRVMAEVREVFEARIEELIPLRAKKVVRASHLSSEHDARWRAARQLFTSSADRHGLTVDERPLEAKLTSERNRGENAQLTLF